jgi:uncharacterized protein
MIFCRFINEIKSIDYSFYKMYYEKMNGMRQNDIIICLPYWLTDALNCHLPLNTIRALSLGNAYMTAYILGQDRILDNQSLLIHEEDIANVMLSSNLLYYKWIKEYQRVFPAHSRVWLFFEKYLAEYSRSTLWEKEEHLGKLQDFTEADLKYLGQKFSPVKISGAGMCLLNNRTEWIPLISELLEQYHIGFQLADDVLDWREDLRNRNYTYILTKMHRAVSATVLSEQEINDHPLARSIAKEVLEKSTFHYLKARDIAKQLSCRQLCTTLDELIEKNEKKMININVSTPRGIDEAEPPLDIDTALRKNEVHCFENNGSHFVFDVNRHLIFSIDQPAYEVLQLIDSTMDATVRNISQSITTSSPLNVIDIIKELMHVGVIRAINQDAELLPKTEKEQSLSIQKNYESIVGLELYISTRSPNRKLMTIEVAKKAINLLFQHSGEYKGEHTVFFSCAELRSDEVNVIQKVIEYSKQMETKLFKTIRFIINVPLMCTNSDLLSQCLTSDLLSSINFSANCEDVFTFSKRTDIRQVSELIIGSKKNICLTLAFDDDSKKVQETTIELRTLGFKIILLQPSDEHKKIGCSNMQDDILFQYEDNNHFYFFNTIRMTVRSVKQKPFRFHCNAGKAYLSVALDGGIFPCLRFIGHPQYSLGTVFTGIGTNQARYLDRDVRNLESCSNCWARFICGGGCMFHSQFVTGSLNAPDLQWCTQYKEQIERSLSRYYNLAPERRKKLVDGVSFNIQFCDSL